MELSKAELVEWRRKVLSQRENIAGGAQSGSVDEWTWTDQVWRFLVWQIERKVVDGLFLWGMKKEVSELPLDNSAKLRSFRHISLVLFGPVTSSDTVHSGPE